MAPKGGNSPSWDPKRYLAFGDERLRPALDLLGRIPTEDAKHVVDLGCGPGNVTPFLQQRFPDAAILGVDSSADMLTQARAALPASIWLEADIAAWRAEEPVDVIYSNAALHWLPNHPSLFPRLLEQLRPGGCLAVQMPDSNSGHWREALRETAKDGPWAGDLAELLVAGNVLGMETYHEVLAAETQALDIWQTSYLHVLAGEDPVFAWTSGAGARPFLDRLEGEACEAFTAAYKDRLRQAYPATADGQVLFPFTRLFLVAIKA